MPFHPRWRPRLLISIVYLLLILPDSHGHGSLRSRNELVNGNSGKNFANQFPSLADTLEMAKLSKLVYHFRHENDEYCASYKTKDGIVCEFYTHNHLLGTQVLIVSNRKKRYIAVVFAGTDDIRTSLEDAHLSFKPFGNNATISLPNKDIKVHSGFDNAVFKHNLWEDIDSRFEALKKTHPFSRIFTTGHSLGGANSILVGTALSIKGYKVTTINFGCPKTVRKFGLLNASITE